MDQAANHQKISNARFKRFPLEHLTETLIAQSSAGGHYVEQKDYHLISPHSLEPDSGIFLNRLAFPLFPPVTVLRQEDQLLVSCTCNQHAGQLCMHEAQVLTALLRKEEFGIFFFPALRKEKLQQFGADYGLGTVQEPDDYFSVQWENNKLVIFPRHTSLQAVTPAALQGMNQLYFLRRRHCTRKIRLQKAKSLLLFSNNTSITGILLLSSILRRFRKKERSRIL